MATALRTDSKNSLRLMRSPARLRQTLLLPQRLCMRVYRVLSQNIDFFRVFFSGYGKQQALQLGRMWEGLKDPKMLSEALNKYEKSRKKAKYAVFCGSDKVAGKLERGRHMAVLNLFHFHEFSDLILLKNVKYFFRNLKRFQTLPLVWSRLSCRPWAFCEIPMFSTLHRRDALSQLSGYPQNAKQF